ncbi:hypothetical protein [[Acholeplasma] multilocale]|uniref:hypothetical protein n=1 Tax=[Acholeplasma] multilocale TaxID=264638 RepID=UPI00047CB59E|nr:hypothetical protein [[Acholeplasma] multilocale]
MKIQIIGPNGADLSLYANLIQEIHHLPLLEVDDGATSINVETLRNFLNENDSWVISGNLMKRENFEFVKPNLLIYIVGEKEPTFRSRNIYRREVLSDGSITIKNKNLTNSDIEKRAYEYMSDENELATDTMRWHQSLMDNTTAEVLVIKKQNKLAKNLKKIALEINFDGSKSKKYAIYLSSYISLCSEFIKALIVVIFVWPFYSLNRKIKNYRQNGWWRKKQREIKKYERKNKKNK